MSIIERFVRFAGVGVIGTIAHYIVLIVMVHLAGIDAVWSSNAGALVGALVNYMLNYQFTFRSKKPHSETLGKFMTVAAIALLLNGVLMFWLNKVLSVHYLIAQLATTTLVLVWTFLANYHWSFRK